MKKPTAKKTVPKSKETDLSKMDRDQAVKMANELGHAVNGILVDARTKADQVLNKYGFYLEVFEVKIGEKNKPSSTKEAAKI